MTLSTRLAPEAVEEARKRWQGVELSTERLQEAWATLTDTIDGPSTAHAADVFLATACLERNPVALEHLSKLISGLLPRFHGFGLGEAQLQALAQDTLTALLVEGPLLKRYSGRGSLEGWLLVVMSRRALRLLEEAKGAAELDEVLLGSLTTDGAPELELLKERFRGSFSRAFRAAISRLGSRRRNLLRQHYLDELSLEEMSVLYRVHRSTVARWLTDARTALLDETRSEVSQNLGVPRHEVESLMRVVSSRLDLSAGLFLSISAVLPSDENSGV